MNRRPAPARETGNERGVGKRRVPKSKRRSQTRAEAAQKRKNEAFLLEKIQEWEVFNKRRVAKGYEPVSFKAYEAYAIQNDKWFPSPRKETNTR